MKRLVLAGFAPILAAFVVTGTTAANEPGSDQIPAADLKELTDPTILVRRVWLETEWNKFTDGTHFVEETLGTLCAWPVTDNQDWAVRLKLPVKFRVGDDMPDIAGFGDVKVAAGTAFRVCKNFRVGGGLDLEMPTGRHELSDNAWRIQEFGAMAWDINSWFSISPSFEYNQSISEEGSAPPLHFLETFFPFNFTLLHKWAISAGYENKVDFEDNNYVTHRAKLLVAKELESIPLSFALSAKRQFDSAEKEFQINFVVSYYFR
jgi:hypothetical protein